MQGGNICGLNLSRWSGTGSAGLLLLWLCFIGHGRRDNKPLGVVLYANNVETLERMLQEYNLLYPVREETVIGIPEPGEEIRCISHTGYAHARVEDLRKPTDCP